MLTARCGLPYPDKDIDPWYDDFEAFADAIDSAVYAHREDRNAIVMGGGAFAWNSGTSSLTWAATIEILAAQVGFLWTIASGSMTLAEGEMLYVTLTRAPTVNTAVVAAKASVAPANDNVFVICVRRNNRLHFRNGDVLSNGETRNVFEEGHGVPAGGVPDPFTPADGTWNVTGNINASGTLTSGSLTQGSVLFAGAGGTISQDNTKLFWDDATDLFMCAGTIESRRNAIAALPTAGVVLQNQTLSTGGAQQQFGPGVEWIGHSWDGGADKEVRFLQYMHAFPGTGAGGLTTQRKVGAGSYATVAQHSSDGNISYYNPVDATSGVTLQDTPTVALVGSYWNGSSATQQTISYYVDLTATTPQGTVTWLAPSNAYKYAWNAGANTDRMVYTPAGYGGGVSWQMEWIVANGLVSRMRSNTGHFELTHGGVSHYFDQYGRFGVGILPASAAIEAALPFDGSDGIMYNARAASTGKMLRIRDSASVEMFVVGTRGELYITPKPFSSGYAGDPTALKVTGAAHTSLPASTEQNDVNLALARTVTFLTGALTYQRAVRVQAPTYAFSAGATLSAATTMAIDSAPMAGANCTMSNSAALIVGPVGADLPLNADYVDTVAVGIHGISNGVGATSSRVGFRAAFPGPVSLGNQTATLTELAMVAIDAAQFVSTTNVRTVTTASSLYIEGPPTNGGNVTFTNGPYSLFIDAGRVRVDDHLEWGAGVAVTATRYSIGRNADATNQLHLNVPTGAGFEFSVNDVARLQMGSSGTFFQLTPPAVTSGALPVSVYVVSTGATHTGVTNSGSSKNADVFFDIARSITFSAASISDVNTYNLVMPSYAADGATTITNLIGVSIARAPNVGSNVTATNAFAMQVGGASSQASSAAFIYRALDIPAHTLTLTGTTQVTSVGPAGLGIGVLTITDSSSVTVDNAAALYIAGPPVQAGSVTLTNAFSLWIDSGPSRFDGRVLQAKGADVASANDITLGADGNYFHITGTTQINRIATAGWTAGAIIAFKFGGSLTVTHNTANGGGFAGLLLAGAGNFSATADDTLVVVYDGTNFRELARTVI